MICISVTPKSRTLAPADLLNASRKCDLIELCLDYFIRTPDAGELIQAVDKPVLVSCRRPQDGGHWAGTEEERLQLLRNAIVAGPAYVELDLDIAHKVPRFGDTKRVISYTSLNRPLGKIDDIFEECWKAKADVVKVTWPTEDLDAAWPLLAAVAGKRELPVVGQGIGRSGLTFSLLGRRYGSPWIYAALERGMEAYDGQPTVWQLEEEYRWQEIGPKTRFLGIVGMGLAENTTARVLNAAFSEMGKPIRCLPIVPGRTDRLQKMLGNMKINGLLVDAAYDGDLSDFASPGDEIAEKTGCMDLLKFSDAGWKGVSTLFPAVDRTASELRPGASWAARKATTVIGSNRLALGTACYMDSLGAAVSVSAPSDSAASLVARQAGARHIPFNAVHSAMCDVLVLADPAVECGMQRGQLNPSIIREGMTVVDLTRYPAESDFAEECRLRGARCAEPSAVFAEQLRRQFRLLAGRDLPDSAFAAALQS